MFFCLILYVFLDHKTGFLVDGRLKELLPAMPVIYMKAVTVQPTWEPSSVGIFIYLFIYSYVYINIYTYLHIYVCMNIYIFICIFIYIHTISIGIGYLRRQADIYECPVYLTSFRGHTYVFLATLKTIDPCNKWVLTGTAILMQTD
jgi:dynein heavy chain